ncbi:hypothetical protein [Spiroplasma endosymbiont of Monopis laevigella]
MADSKDCLDKNVEENIKFISSKIIEKKTILFLGRLFNNLCIFVLQSY